MRRDTGLQPERTNLAWNRTALAAAACALVMLHVAAERGWGVATVPAVCTAAVAVTLVLLGRPRHLGAARPPAGRRAGDARLRRRPASRAERPALTPVR